MQQFAYFLEKLAATPDGDGTLLDHSMILCGSGISDGDKHNHDNLPHPPRRPRFARARSPLAGTCGFTTPTRRCATSTCRS